MRELLLRGARVEETNNRGSSALHLVCASQRPRVEAAVGLFLRSGASETAVDSFAGLTPAGVLERLANRRKCSAEEAERTRVPLERAPADRAWRRRCWLVMLRAKAEKESVAQCLVISSDGEILGTRGKGCAKTIPLGRSRSRDGGEGGACSQKAARTDSSGGSGGGRGEVGGQDAVVTAREAALRKGAWGTWWRCWWGWSWREYSGPLWAIFDNEGYAKVCQS